MGAGQAAPQQAKNHYEQQSMIDQTLSPATGHLVTKSPGHLFPRAPVKAAEISGAGGGSGGHISAGVAIAERLAERSPQCRSIFICSLRAIDASMLRDAVVEFVAVQASPPAF